MTVEELRENLLHIVTGDSAKETVDSFVIAIKKEQLKKDLATVNQIPEYMVANIEGWIEGSAKSPQGDLLITLAKASAKYVKELIPDLFPEEKP